MYPYSAPNPFGSIPSGLSHEANNIYYPVVEAQYTELHNPTQYSPVVSIASHNAQPRHPNRIEYERVIDDNARLTLELKKSKEEHARTTKTVQDLAAWMHDERQRLIQEMAKLQATNERLQIILEDQDSKKQQGGVESFYGHRKPVGTMEQHRMMEISTPPLYPSTILKEPLFTSEGIAEMDEDTMNLNNDRHEAGVSKYWNQDGAAEKEQNYSPSDAGDTLSVTNQVDKLIAEEKRRLPMAEHLQHSLFLN